MRTIETHTHCQNSQNKQQATVEPAERETNCQIRKTIKNYEEKKETIYNFICTLKYNNNICSTDNDDEYLKLFSSQITLE